MLAFYTMQKQYIFIHDAILEAIACGDTQINASDLRRAIKKLSCRDPATHLTVFENQLKACVTLRKRTTKSSIPTRVCFTGVYVLCTHAGIGEGFSQSESDTSQKSS